MIAVAHATLDHAVLGATLLAAGAALAPAAVAIGRRWFPGRNVFFARWGFANAVVVALVGVLGAFAAAQLVRALDLALAPILVDCLIGILGLTPACVLVAVLARRKDPRGIGALGWSGDHVLRAATLGAFAYALALPALIGATLLWPWLFERLGGTWTPQQAAVEIPKLMGDELALAIFLVCIVQPLLEELLFRSFLQPLLVQNLGDRGGVALAAVLFAALHGASAFLPVLVLALVLGMLMLRTQRLIASWFVHALHNGLVLYLLLESPTARELFGFDLTSASIFG